MSYNSIAIACPELPLPVKDPQSGENGTVRHMQIKTRLSPKKAIGFLHRNYAPPSLSHTFLQLVKYASDSIDTPGASPLIAMLGEKGAGKTSAAEAAYYLVDGEMPEVFDCGDRSLDELLWEPVIADSSRSLVARLEQRYNSGTINPLNKTFIEAELGEAIRSAETGEKTLDFGLIGPERIQAATKAIDTALKLEGISAVAGIDISYKEGPLIRVWRAAQEAQKKGQDRPCRLIVDEIDKRQPNSGKSLQQVWLVIQGLRESHTVSKNGMEFSFSRKDMPSGFSVVITGNDARDLGGEAQSGLSQSQATRMTILPVGESTEEDLTHRICQFLTGIPFGVLDLLPQNGKAKGKLLMELRALGSEETVNQEQTWLLENQERTLQAARQLAGFMTEWAKLVDPENPLIDDPDMEANAAFREPVGVRKIQSLIIRALKNDLFDINFAPAEPSPNPVQSLLNQSTGAQAKEEGIGERICRVILEDIPRSSTSPQVKGKVLELAKLYGIQSDPDEEDLANKNHKPISSLLNDKEETFKIEPTTKALQASFYKAILETYGEKLGNPPPSEDDLLPLRDLQAAANTNRERAARRTTCETTYMLNINPNFLEGTRSEQAVECIPVLCPTSKAHRETLVSLGKEKVYEGMMKTETLVALLKTPDLGEGALDALWNEAWRKQLNGELVADKTKLRPEDESPECVAMADGSHKHLRVAKVLTMGKDRPEASVILQSRELRKTWVISENGKSERIESKDATVLCYEDKASAKLWKDLKEDLGGEIEANLMAALHALHNLPEGAEPKPEEAIAAAFQRTEEEKAKNTRVLRNTKIPLRVPEANLPGIS